MSDFPHIDLKSDIEEAVSWIDSAIGKIDDLFGNESRKDPFLEYEIKLNDARKILKLIILSNKFIEQYNIEDKEYSKYD